VSKVRPQLSVTPCIYRVEQNNSFNKKFWEKLISYFSLITDRIENDACNNSYTVACVFVASNDMRERKHRHRKVTPSFFLTNKENKMEKINDCTDLPPPSSKRKNSVGKCIFYF
jgi:hypothetical protein